MKPAIIAHRGASADAPENTLAAFKLAWRQGADAIEMDLWPARDGKIAVIHDQDLKRVAGLRKKVCDLESNELRALDLGSWKDARWSGEGVPSLDAVLALVPAKRRVFLELKGDAAMLPELKRCLHRSGLDVPQVCLIAFQRKVLLLARALMPEVECAWVVQYRLGRSLKRVIARAVSDGFHALDLSAKWPLSKKRVAMIHRAGLKLYIWTVDRVSKARRLALCGVDGITTNVPGRIREALV